jgi:hypothetical protein
MDAVRFVLETSTRGIGRGLPSQAGPEPRARSLPECARRRFPDQSCAVRRPSERTSHQNRSTEAEMQVDSIITSSQHVLPSCPSWCTSEHGVQDGEEDWVHLGAPLLLADGVSARLCVSFDPVSGLIDGPIVLIGDREHSLAETAALGAGLTALAESASTTSS